MAVYNQVLLYTFRDSLASGDPQKVIFGSYFDGEFGAIHTASLDAVSLSGNNTIAGNNSFTGTNTFSGAGITTTFAGKIVVGPPSSGTTMTVNVLDNAAITFSGPNSSRGYQLNFFDTTASAFRGFIGIGISTVTGAVATDFAVSPGASGSVVIGTANGGAIATRFGPNGNVTINAPSSGTTLTVTGIASQYAGFFTGGGAAGTQRGLSVVTSTQNAADKILNANNSISNLLDIFADGHGDLGPNLSWTTGGAWTIAQTSGSGLTVTAPAGGFATNAQGSGTASQSFGALVSAGTNSSDQALRVQNAAGSTQYFVIRGDGAIQGAGTVAATLVDMTPDKGSFTATLNGGVTTNPTATVNWVKMGNLVMMDCVAGLTATSNSTANPFITGVPATLVGARNSNFLCSRIMDNSVTITTAGYVVTNVSGQITFAKESLFTAANSKGINAGCSWMYSLA